MVVGSLLNVSQKLSHSSKKMWNMVKSHVSVTVMKFCFIDISFELCYSSHKLLNHFCFLIQFASFVSLRQASTLIWN
jgi:hypothetical protein